MNNRRISVWKGYPREAKGWGLNPKAQFLTQLLLNDHPALYIASGRRTEAHNARIRGATKKGHTSGDEVDLNGPRDYPDGELALLVEAEQQALLTPGTKTVIHDSGTGLHLHVRWPRTTRTVERVVR